MQINRKCTYSVSVVVALMLTMQSCNPNQNIVSPPTTNLTPTAQVLPRKFGKAEWEYHLGKVDEEPPLPGNIDEILESVCPFRPNKKIKETHLLVMIPTTINNKPLTFDQLKELVKDPLQGKSTNLKFESMDDEDFSDALKKILNGSAPPQKPYWVLMTRDVVTKNENGYDNATVLEAAVTILTHYVHSGEWLHKEMCAYCKEKTAKGRTFFVTKHYKEDKLLIGAKATTMVRFASNENINIPQGGSGKSLLRRL